MNEDAKNIVFLDRDGVLIANRPDYVKDIFEIEFLPHTFEAMRRLTDLGVKVYVVTNQSCIGQGIITEEWANTLNQYIELSLAIEESFIDEFFVCPHEAEEGCSCRKPNPDLWYEGLHYAGEVGKTFMVGDSLCDIVGAKALGIQPFLVMTGKGKETLEEDPSLEEYKCDNLLEAVKEIEKCLNVQNPSTPAENATPSSSEVTEA